MSCRSWLKGDVSTEGRGTLVFTLSLGGCRTTPLLNSSIRCFHVNPCASWNTAQWCTDLLPELKGSKKKKKKGHKAQFFYESLLTQLVVISGTRLFPDSTISFCRFCWKKHSLTSAVQCSTTVSCCYWKTIDDGLAWRDEVLGVSVISKSRIGSFLLNYGNSTNDYNSLFIKEWGSSSVYICT